MLLTEINHSASIYEKNKKDFQWDKDVHFLLDNRMGLDQMSLQKIHLRDKLAKGEMPPLNPLLMASLNIKMYGHARKKDFNTIPHFPLIDQVIGEAIGELEKQPFEPSAVDISLYSGSEKNRLHLMQLQDGLKKHIYEPYKEKITREYMMQYGVADITQMSHEDQQQMQSDISNRIQQMMPEKINEYFDKEYVSPFSEMAQMLLDLECKSKNLKDHFDTRFFQGYNHGLEMSYIYESHGMPRIKTCFRKGASWEGGEDVDCIEDGDALKYEMNNRSLIEIINDYGGLLSKSDLEKLESLGNFGQGLNGDFNIQGPILESQMMGFYADNYKELYPDGINIRTPEGQDTMLRLRSMFYRGGANRKYRDCHIVYKTPIMINMVTRVVNGRVEFCWRDSDYVMNPDYGDIEIKAIKSIQVRGCRAIGEGKNKIYIDAGPLKYDWADISDPRKKKLPYSGGFYGRESGGEPVPPMEKGINFQIKVNVEAGRLEEEKGFNIGKVFLMLESARPDDWTPEMFFDVMKGTRVISLDETKLNPTLAGALLQGGRIFNSIDMSNIVAIKDSIEQIEILYRNMRRAMGAQEREISPYASMENVRASQQNASSRTFDVYNKHNKYVNNTLQMYMDFCMYVYRKNPAALSWVANDMNMEMLISDDFLNFGRMGVFVGNTIEDQISLREFKQETLPFIQNGAYEVIGEFARIKQAKSWGEILQAAESLTRKAKNMREQAQASQQQQQQQLAQQEAEAIDKQLQHQDKLATDKNMTAIELADINSKQMYNAVDVDKDNQSDINQRNDATLEYERQRDEKDRRLKEKQMAIDREIDLKKIEASLKVKRLATKVKK